MKSSRKYRTIANLLSATDAAYIAGLVDGEGCLYAILKNGCVHGALELSNTNHEIIDFLAAQTGVGSTTKIAKRNQNAKPIRLWRVPICSLGSLLTQLLPFLRIKRKQADLMLKLASYEYPAGAPDAERLGIIAEFRQLNRRGATVLN